MKDRKLSEASKKLSWLQKRILQAILEYTTLIETSNNDHAKALLNIWGVPWYPAKGQEDWERSDSAIISRALRRLEARGLVERNNDITRNGRRTTRVKLTPLGLSIAKRLTKTDSENVSHL